MSKLFLSYINCLQIGRQLQGDKKVSVHLMITIQNTIWLNLTADRQGQWDTRLTLTPSVIPSSKDLIMVSN
jgi:hypothetical protein